MTYQGSRLEISCSIQVKFSPGIPKQTSSKSCSLKEAAIKFHSVRELFGMSPSNSPLLSNVKSSLYLILSAFSVYSQLLLSS